jgi:hypothetical protein
MANIYRLGRSAGVRGLRVSEADSSINQNLVIRQDFVGVALDTEADVWKTSLLGTSRTLLTEAITPGTGQYFPAVRINHPELGSILYVDFNKPPIRANLSSGMVYTTTVSETIYTGEDGGTDGDQYPSGIKYVLLDGTSFIVENVPA